MPAIVGRNSGNGYSNVYFQFNGAILVFHRWTGNGGDEDNEYLENQYSVYHDNLEGVMDLHISWSVYESGYVEVFNLEYPDGFNIQELKNVLEEELGIEMPTSRK